MSKYYPRLNFERGDAVGVLLFNEDTREVVLVQQFKLPTLIGRRRDSPSTQNGWITEVMAGMIADNESSEETAIRRTRQETGYEIEKPELICRFLSSPGGTSERIFLYFAKVTDGRRAGAKKKPGDQDIALVKLSVNDLFEQLERGEIEDPKLVIAAYWLKDNMPRIESLDPDTVDYEVEGNKDVIIGYKTGDIKCVRGIDVWVNGEPSDMMMDRFIGRSVSARIRSMGADKEDGVISEDTIQESLRGLMGGRPSVDIGKVFITESGMLRQTNDVQLIFHVAAISGGLGKEIKAEERHLRPCVESVLAELDRENKRISRRLWRGTLGTVLFPMIGAGDGGLPIRPVAENIIPPVIEYFKSTPNPSIKKIYFLAFRLQERNACEHVIKRYCDKGDLRLLPKTAGPGHGPEALGGENL